MSPGVTRPEGSAVVPSSVAANTASSLDASMSASWCVPFEQGREDDG